MVYKTMMYVYAFLYVLVLGFLSPSYFLAFANTADGDLLDEQHSWWPKQAPPKKVVICKIQHDEDVAELNLAQSVSGLASQALNEGRYDEGVWVTTKKEDYASYYKTLIQRICAEEIGEQTVWELVVRYQAAGIVKGYILYDYQRLDNSISLATVYAGLLQGILIDVTQEKRAKAMGLTKLKDVVEEEFNEKVFHEVTERLNPNLLVLMDPKVPNNRDYAIAHRSMVYYGTDGLFPAILKWVKPLSPVIGWNKGDEFQHIAPCTNYGLINTVSDWCFNLPLLSISDDRPLQKIATMDPKTIDWDEDVHHHAFVMSDGDNMQWAFGNFLNNADYWSNTHNTEVSMSFTSCILNLSLAGRDVYDYMVYTQPKDVSVVEYMGGYYYPDLFASETDDPTMWLRKYASMINTHMKRTGTKVFGFICRDVSSESAQRAYQIFAEEIEELVGMIAVQYIPYNGGHGEVFWVPNKQGIQIPVVSAKYQLWANLNRPGSGNPTHIAGLLNEASQTAADKQLDWTIVHAWSHFNDPSHGIQGKDVKSESSKRGVTPVKWVKDRLSNDIRLINIEELLWRIRMKYYPMETKEEINRAGEGYLPATTSTQR